MTDRVDPSSGISAADLSTRSSSRRKGFLRLSGREKRALSRRVQSEFQSDMKSNSMVKWMALAAGVALVIALGVDLTKQAQRYRKRPIFPAVNDPLALALGIKDRTYQDSMGRFRITVPQVWAVLTGVDIAPFDVRFGGPGDLEVSVRVSPASHNRFDLLLREIGKIEDTYGVNMNIQTNTFRGLPCVIRTTRMTRRTVRALDFLANGNAHHLQAVAGREGFEKSEVFLTEILKTYDPGPFDQGEEGVHPMP